MTVHKSQTPDQVAEFTAQYQPVSGIGDAAWIFIPTPHGGPAPTTTINVTALKGTDTASFTLHATPSPSGPSTGQLQQQLLNLIGGIDF